MEFENVFLFIKLNFTKNERSYLSFVIIFDEQVEVISGGERDRDRKKRRERKRYRQEGEQEKKRGGGQANFRKGTEMDIEKEGTPDGREQKKKYGKCTQK